MNNISNNSLKSKMTIRKLYNEVLKKRIELDNATELLSIKASEIYGKSLTADICGDYEIEFRLSDDNAHSSTSENAFSIEITIEELEKIESSIKKRNPFGERTEREVKLTERLIK